MQSGDLEGKPSGVLSMDPLWNDETKVTHESVDADVQVTCFTEELHDITLHFQIIRFSKQIYAWVGCNSGKFGHLYAAAPSRISSCVSVASLLGGNADNTGSSMARRLVLKTGLSVVLACNIPKDSPMLEATAERKLIEKFRSLGYIGQDRAEAPLMVLFSSTAPFFFCCLARIRLNFADIDKLDPSGQTHTHT